MNEFLYLLTTTAGFIVGAVVAQAIFTWWMGPDAP